MHSPTMALDIKLHAKIDNQKQLKKKKITNIGNIKKFVNDMRVGRTSGIHDRQSLVGSVFEQVEKKGFKIGRNGLNVGGRDLRKSQKTSLAEFSQHTFAQLLIYKRSSA